MLSAVFSDMNPRFYSIFWPVPRLLLSLFLLGFGVSGFGDELSKSQSQNCAHIISNLAQPWNQTISFPTIVEKLKSAEIIDLQDMKVHLEVNGKYPTGTMGALLITFSDGSRAVWKTDKWGSINAEVGAYRIVYELLDQRMVPPTTSRDIARELARFRLNIPKETLNKITSTNGSIQYFVRSSFDLNQRSVLNAALINISPKDESDREIYYFVFGQWDRNTGNLVIDDSYTQALIDNATIKQRQKVRFGEMPFVMRHRLPKGFSSPDQSTDFPFEQAVTLIKPGREELHAYLYSIMGHEEFEKLWETEWIKKTDRTMSFVVWDGALWVQRIGFAAYPPLVPKVYSDTTLNSYAKLNFTSLRSVLDPKTFSDIWIKEVLDRRDMILNAAKTAPHIP